MKIIRLFLLKQRLEYTHQLIDVLSQPMGDGIKSIYDESKFFFNTNKFKYFNNFPWIFGKSSSWNNELVENETAKVIKLNWL